jgi:hypothetical protein
VLIASKSSLAGIEVRAERSRGMTMSDDTDAVVWPDIDVSGWAPTKRSLHLYLQMLGKMRVVLSPSQPNWMFTALLPNARGVTTGPMPWRGTSLEASLDVFSSEILVERSNGTSRRIALVPARTVAEIYAELESAIAALGVECAISPIPQEVPDTTPLDEDRRPAAYDPQAVQRWFSATTAAATFFDEWRATFFGRTGIQVWWGALDVALLLFNGKHVPPPTGRGYLLKYDLDAEMMNAGLYFGDEKTPPFFYGYVYPQPPGAETAPIAPAAASWSDTIKEWVLPYDAVRHAAEPERELQAFLDAIYAQCVSAAGWDRAALSYEAPSRKLDGTYRRPRGSTLP